MRRRRPTDDAANLLTMCLMAAPSWVGPVLAVLTYVTLRYALPQVLGTRNAMAAAFAGFAPVFAFVGTMFIVVVWLVAEVGKWHRRRLVDSARAIGDLLGLSWRDFEALVGEVFRRQGFQVDETGSAAGDGGIDLILRRGAEKVVVQCKRWRDQKVSVKEVRELLGVLLREGATSAILATTSTFTDDAWAEAKGQPIQLINGQQLCALLSAVRSPCAHARGQAASATSADPKSDTHARPDAGRRPEGAPLCPRCGRQMVLRTARTGAQAGSKFWGCSTYPRCHGTRPFGPS